MYFSLWFLSLAIFTPPNKFSFAAFVPLQSLLDGVHNCEVNILHDCAADSTVLQFRNLLPTRISMRNLSTPPIDFYTFQKPELVKLLRPLPLYIIRTRELYCKIKIIVGASLLLRRKPFPFQPAFPSKLSEWIYTLSHSLYYTYLRFNKISYKLLGAKYVTSIIVTDLGKTQFYKSLIGPRLFYIPQLKYVDDIVTVFSLGSKGGFEICLQLQGNPPNLSKNRRCKVCQGAILEDISKLRIPPKHWLILQGGPGSQRVNVIPPKSNPFDRKRNESIEVQLAQYIYMKTNASIFTCKDDARCEKFLIPYFPAIYRQRLTIADVPGVDPVTTGYSGYQFLTCHTQSIFTIEFYIKPFQPEIWLGLFLCLGLLAARTINEAEWREFGMGLFNERLHVWNNLTNYHPIRNKMPHISNNCFRLLSRIDVEISTPEYEFLHFMAHIGHNGHALYYDRWADITSSDMPNLFLLFHLTNLKFAYTPEHASSSDDGIENLDILDTMVESDVTNCGRTVLIAKSNMINAEYDYMSRAHPDIIFYKGKQILESNQEGWVFTRAGSSKVPRYYRFLLEAGVYAKLEDEITARKSYGHSYGLMDTVKDL
ncbi:hypothetical protein Fcan01_11348 [Folsomia candida]|uniref:Uncharacterized protein n=1 Tax=Folsomia candida TaxID=158441 RepID=A0A226EBX5_FOLCA|nr:hypothetical protein Fcan01_11348 [Folsomia candida]